LNLRLPGKHSFGPSNAVLTVRTGTAGAAARAGHDLLIDVRAWDAAVEGGEQPAMVLSADPGSLRVREATGGMTPLGDHEKARIERTIGDHVLKGAAIEFRSSDVVVHADRLAVRGELELAGRRRPIAFELVAGRDGRLAGSATVRQTDWGIKPYSALFGALKLRDEVEVVFEAPLRAAHVGEPRRADEG